MSYIVSQGYKSGKAGATTKILNTKISTVITNMIWFCLIFITTQACQSNKKVDIGQYSVKSVDIVTIGKSNETQVSLSSSDLTTKLECDFNCKVFLRISYGRIQNPNESFGICRMGQCISDENSFDIIWLLNKPTEERSKTDSDELKDLYETYLKDEQYHDLFKVFYFKMPMKKVHDPLLDDPYYFPVYVEVYIQENYSSKPLFLKKQKLSNWNEYVKLQIEVLGQY